MQRLPFRRLMTGSRPAPDRVFLMSIWFKDHNNPRYAELLPRLGRLEAYLAVCSDRPALRSAQFWSFRWTRRLNYIPVMLAGSRRYSSMLTLDNEQIPWFRGQIVSDVDDPLFSPREAMLLSRPNVAAYVVTAERAARRFEDMGVEKPWHVIPQGISHTTFTADLVEEAQSMRRKGEVVVGYIAAFLLSAGDRDGDDSLYNVDHLLDLWDEIHARRPDAQLWLIGRASNLVQNRCRGREDVVLFGLLPRDQALAHTANFDIALYPRTKDQGIRAAKVADYIGLGVPTVSYDYEVTENLREAGAGILAATPREFVDAVVGLIAEPTRRAQLASLARTAAAELDWDVLARRFEDEILDRYLSAERPL